MDEKEYQKYCVGRWKYNTRDNINGFSNSNRMRWLFFPHYKASLDTVKKINERERERLDEWNVVEHIFIIISGAGVVVFLIIIIRIIFHIVLLIIDNVEITTPANLFDDCKHRTQAHAHATK